MSKFYSYHTKSKVFRAIKMNMTQMLRFVFPGVTSSFFFFPKCIPPIFFLLRCIERNTLPKKLQLFPKQAFVFTCLLKRLWKKEKLLVMYNFSFSHNVFYHFRELSAIFFFLSISASPGAISSPSPANSYTYLTLCICNWLINFHAIMQQNNALYPLLQE